MNGRPPGVLTTDSGTVALTHQMFKIFRSMERTPTACAWMAGMSLGLIGVTLSDLPVCVHFPGLCTHHPSFGEAP